MNVSDDSNNTINSWREGHFARSLPSLILYYKASDRQQISRPARHDNLSPLVISTATLPIVISSERNESRDLPHASRQIFLNFYILFLFSTSFSLYMLHLRLREFTFSPTRDSAGEKYREFHWKEC